MSPTPRRTVSAPSAIESATRLRGIAARRTSAGQRRRHAVHRLDPARIDRDDPVGASARARHRGRSAASCARAAAARPHPRRPGARGVEIRGRLVEHDERRVAEKRTGEGNALGLPVDSCRPPSPTIVAYAVRQAGDERRPRRPAPRRRGRDRRPRRPVTEPDVVGHRAAEQRRALRHPGDLPCATPPDRSPRDRGPDEDPAALRARESQQERCQRALAAAASPDERDASRPARNLESQRPRGRPTTGRDTRTRRRRTGSRRSEGSGRHRSRPAPRGRLDQRQAAGRQRRRRRRSHGIRQRGCAAAGRAPARAPARSAPARSAIPPSTSRTPTVTATSATPSVAASSSTVPERNARRSVPIVAVRYSSLDCSISPELRLPTIERSQRRQPANDIEKVRRQQRHRLPALACPVPGGPADQPEEHGHEGKREQHQAGGDEIE